MAWGQGNKQPEPDADAAGKSRFAAPPTCPRCELTKSQMNRTIQNYQKAYRKKVEGLKQELTTRLRQRQQQQQQGGEDKAADQQQQQQQQQLEVAEQQGNGVA
ncbi:hypothetical protein OEZ85_005120 [Tetradesmus obliquus]|uniref:Uncharacterized protein n=1 Tax=Tetradesmus obliquus TaxID=3088 RepID=A0ABY8UGV2_TETOB|nr:hypothetical protein OEZ85_005120 [Tetradesmus obliquus]